jgi:hypothetical protein
MELKNNYLVWVYNDRGSPEYNFYTEEQLVKLVTFYDPYVKIYKLEKELTKEDAETLGLRIIN